MPPNTVLSRNTICGFKEESTEGVYNAPLAGDVIQVTDIPEFKPTVEKLDRDLVRGSLGDFKPLNGMRGGQLTVKYENRAAGHTANVSDQPEAHALIKNALGKYNAGTNATTHASTPSTSTVLNLVGGQGASFAVYDAVFVLGEVRFVVSISTDALTLNEALTAGAPAVSTPVRAAHNYKPGNTNYTHLSAAVWRDAETSGVLEKGLGCKTSSFAFANTEVGQIPLIEQTLEMLDFDQVSGQTSPANPVFEDQEPAVAIYGFVRRADATIPIGTFEFEIANTVSPEKSIDAVSGKARQFITHREVTGKIDPLMDRDGVALQDAFEANTTFELFMVLGIRDGGGLFVQGTCMAIYMPNVIFTTQEGEDQDGLMKHSFEFKAHQAATGIGDDEVALSYV